MSITIYREDEHGIAFKVTCEICPYDEKKDLFEALRKCVAWAGDRYGFLVYSKPTINSRETMADVGYAAFRVDSKGTSAQQAFDDLMERNA